MLTPPASEAILVTADPGPAHAIAHPRRKLTAVVAIAEFGEDEVEQCIAWLSAELQARNASYGTRSVYSRYEFMTELARYRDVLNCKIKAPPDWASILAC